MDNKQARKLGRVGIVLGCILVILGQLWLGLAFVAASLLCMAVWGRCPHCGRQLVTLPPAVKKCPRCKKTL